MLPSEDSCTVLTVQDVRLTKTACESARKSGIALAEADSPLFHLQYRRKRTTLSVHLRLSKNREASQLQLDEPFHSVCQVINGEPEVGDSEWKCVAQLDNLPPCEDGPSKTLLQANGSLAVPGGLCHPHIHLDKCFLLDRCKISDGTFDEAMTETGRAKAEFNYDDLMARGRRLIRASISHGVTAMRAHVEVDPTVQHLCVKAGIALKTEFSSVCDIQLVAFAQDPLFYPKDEAKEKHMTDLLEKAASMPEIDALGSAPYVESADDGSGKQIERQRRNLCRIFSLAARNGKDVDLHLDYDLDPSSESLVPYVMELTAAHTWKVGQRARRVTLGHCTKLSTFSEPQLKEIRTAMESVPSFEDGKRLPSPISFVGLPPSDVYMQGRAQPYASRSRATLPLLKLADTLDGAFCAMGVNNVANLFTPQGDADPLALLPWATALFQDATQSAHLLSFVSTQARYAAGVDDHPVSLWKDLVVLDTAQSEQSAVLAPPFGRVTIKNGRIVSQRSVHSQTLTTSN